MTKSISCSDAGVDCNWSATGATDEEILEKATEHVKESHKDMEINSEFAEKVKSLIKDI